MQIVASNDIGPAVLILFLAPLVIAVLAGIVLVVRRVSARQESGARSRWGLVLGLVPLAFGALMTFFLLTVRGGAPRFFYLAAALPILIGIRIIQVWIR